MRALPRVGEHVRWMMASRARPRRAMGSAAAGGGRDPAENPKVGRLRELFVGDADAAGEGGGESSLSCRLLRVGEGGFGGRLVWFGRGCLYEGWARMCVGAWALDRWSGLWRVVGGFSFRL